MYGMELWYDNVSKVPCGAGMEAMEKFLTVLYYYYIGMELRFIIFTVQYEKIIDGTKLWYVYSILTRYGVRKNIECCTVLQALYTSEGYCTF